MFGRKFVHFAIAVGGSISELPHRRCLRRALPMFYGSLFNDGLSGEYDLSDMICEWTGVRAVARRSIVRPRRSRSAGPQFWMDLDDLGNEIDFCPDAMRIAIEEQKVAELADRHRVSRSARRVTACKGSDAASTDRNHGAGRQRRAAAGAAVPGLGADHGRARRRLSGRAARPAAQGQQRVRRPRRARLPQSAGNLSGVRGAGAGAGRHRPLQAAGARSAPRSGW